MRKIVLLLLVVCAGFASCSQKEKVITPRAMQAQVDSIVASKMNDINAQAKEDLDLRTAILVKVKADSIVAASNNKQLHADSLAGKFKHVDTAAKASAAKTPASFVAKPPAPAKPSVSVIHK